MSPGSFIGGICPDPTCCQHRGRHAAGPWTCDFNHPQEGERGAAVVVERDRASLLTPDAARLLTEEVKADAVALWAKLRALYEGKAHIALGYSSWGDYFEEEFGRSGNYGYRLLKSAEVMEQLPMGNSRPASERVARELVPLLAEPDAMREAWAESLEQSEGEPTAAGVRATVNGHKSKAAPPSADAEVRSAIDAAGRALRRAVKLIEKETAPSEGEPEWLDRASAVADTARRYIELVSREGTDLDPSGKFSEGSRGDALDDLDFDHARRHLAEREAELREEAGSPARCVCARPLVGPEDTCVGCGRARRA
jgi:hypothetical protein